MFRDYKKTADSQLNPSYQQLMARLEFPYLFDPKPGEEYSTKVKESQRAWIKLRDTNRAVEAFEIETGKPAYAGVINNCVAKMSQERSVYLDRIAPDIGAG